MIVITLPSSKLLPDTVVSIGVATVECPFGIASVTNIPFRLT
jgi:hypothetical protein